MAINSAQLLKLLEPAVRPGATRASTAPARAGFEHQSFDQMLAQVARGTVHSGRQIDVACDPAIPLEPSQLERMAVAADQAEAAGAKRALLLIDGRAFVLDVANRTLTTELSNDPATRLQNVDAAILVPGDDEALFGNLTPSSLSTIISSAIQNPKSKIQNLKSQI